jgi:hypothetical protein
MVSQHNGRCKIHTFLLSGTGSLLHSNSRQSFISCADDTVRMYFLFSCSPLTAEIVKNLALAGVGCISIDTNAHMEGLKSSKLIGQSDDLVAYARSLNPYVKVVR